MAGLRTEQDPSLHMHYGRLEKEGKPEYPYGSFARLWKGAVIALYSKDVGGMKQEDETNDFLGPNLGRTRHNVDDSTKP